jgi:hypothetical protein
VTPMTKTGATLFALLACTTAYYIVAGRFSEALESVAWYALLILFVLEITQRRVAALPWARAAMRLGRIAATLAIAATAVLYLREKEWLDAANLFLWIAVVVVLEIEMRRPAAAAAHRKVFTLTVAALFAALGCMVVAWIAMGKWMNAWDGTLWLAAFGFLEIKILKISFKNK